MARRKKKKPYKIPTIIRSKSGDWYIQYYFEPPNKPGEWDVFKVRGINHIHNLVEKEIEAGYLRDDVEDWLKSGNGPYDYMLDIREQITEAENKIAAVKKANSGWTMEFAIDKYISYITFKGYTYNTVRTYKRYVNTLKTWCIDNDCITKPIARFSEFELEEFLTEAAEINEWSARTFNNYLEYYGGFFAKSESLEKRDNKKNKQSTGLRYDIATRDIETRITNPQRNKPYNPILGDKIKVALRKKGRENLRDYIRWIYYSMMRPDEIRHLKVENIDHISRQIRIIGKTGDRLVPISDQLLAVIKERKVLFEPQKSFVFGYMGKLSPKRMSVAYFLEQYKALKDEIGSDTDLGPYNWKHTGVQDLLYAGFSEEEVMGLTGHKTKEAFRAYTKGFVIDKSHVMKGKTVDF